MTNQICDQTIMWDCLKDQKYLASTYTTMATEMACTGLLQDALKVGQEEIRINYDLFQLMNQRGWYPVSAANQQEVGKVKSKSQTLQSTIQSTLQSSSNG